MADRSARQAASRRSRAERAIERLVLGLLQLLNPVMKPMLRSPLHPLVSRWFLLLSFTGRKSGRRVDTPASYFARHNGLNVTTKRSWWRNLAHHGAVEATVRGRRDRWTVEVIQGREIVERLSGAPSWFLVLAGLDDGVLGRPTRAQLQRSADEGRVVVALRPEASRD